jgi:hypothetical protein
MRQRVSGETAYGREIETGGESGGLYLKGSPDQHLVPVRPSRTKDPAMLQPGPGSKTAQTYREIR